MLDTLHTIGSKITQFFGDPDIGYRTSYKRGEEIRQSVFGGAPFADLLPYVTYDEETELFINQQSVGFTLEAVPLVGGDESIEKVLQTLFNELLDEKGSIQCLLVADHRTGSFLDKWQSAKASSQDILKKLAQQRVNHIKQDSSYRHFRFILSYSVFCEDPSLHILSQLKAKKEKFLSILKTLTYAIVWQASHLLEFVGSLVNFDPAPTVYQPRWNPYENLSNQLTRGGRLTVEQDHLAWHKEQTTLFKSYRPIEYPTHWTLFEMQKLIGDVFRESARIHTPFYLHFGVHCPRQKKAENSFWKRGHLVEKQGQSGHLLRWIPELRQELQECQEVRSQLKESARFVWTQLSVGLWSEEKQLAHHEQSLKTLFRMNQFSLVANTCVHLPQFIATLPMTWATYATHLKNLNLMRTTLSTECVNLMPIQADWLGTPTACMLLTSRRGQLLNWNPFDNQTGNYNVVVSGRSGSGKSVFMQDLLVSTLSAGAKVFIIDVGRSYEKVNELLDGQQIEFSKESTLCLNPFSNISLTDSEARNLSITVLKSVIGCMAAPTAGTNDIENSLIEKAIQTVWKQKQQAGTITDVADWLIQQEDNRAKSLGIMLTPYTKEGIYGRHFEGQNNVNFKNQMVLIELEELKNKKDLQVVVLQLFIMTITNQAFLGDRKTPFMICIDEAWDLLRGNQSGLFIETLARRLRKYNGSLVIGTQGLEDFFATPGAKAAFENSDWMCLLSQKKSSIHGLIEAGKLTLTESQKVALESVHTRQGQYSEIMICDAESNYSITRLILDSFSQLLYTTKADEFSAIQQLRRQGYSLTAAIEILLEGKKDNKFKKSKREKNNDYL